MSCKCQCCGKRYYIDIIVSDKDWKRIQPPEKPTGAGLLCGSCIVERLEAKNIHDSYRLIRSKDLQIVIEKLLA